ncbi:MAG: alpha/beta fold hydrolase [Acidobacteria bacterium]|nr:alpha/beta fold hydrolase [Acidobacteriota bacterium]
MVRFHSILAAIFVLGTAAQAPAQPQPASTQALPASFTVFMSGGAIGSEQVTVTASPEGWTIRATGRLGAPISLSTSRFELRYDRDWKPLSLEIDAALRGQPRMLRTAFANGKATSSIIQAGQESQKTDDVAIDTMVLPNMFFGAFEALALRLAAVSPGGQLKAYVAPEAEIAIRLDTISDERIQTASRMIVAKRYDITLINPKGTVAAEVWADEGSRLVRFRVPAQGLDVARDDVAAVSSRVERMARPTDEQTRIQASGFTLAATVSKPAAAGTGAAIRLPAVVLVPGSGPADRDETVSGVSIFAQLANAIADAGFLVIRYDKRGIGQSGGRDESATLVDYSDDVRAVVRYLTKRKDVDPKRVTLVGHSEGGLVSMLAASEERKNVAALALIATPGTTGADLVLEQQRHLLGGMNLSDEEKQRRMGLQKQIHAAVVTGNGWEAIPPPYRRQADTPWFKSFLTFDPARIMRKVPQPILIVQADRDREVMARHGQLLAGMAKARKNNPVSELSVVEGANHLLVPAATGEMDEYASLRDRAVSPGLIAALVGWLKDTLHVDIARPGR